MQASGSAAGDGAEQKCVHCGEDGSNYLDEGSKLLCAPCGHIMCAKCKGRVFRGKRQILCPVCSEVVYMHRLSEKSAEQREFEAESGVRKRLASIFNQSRSSFDSDAAYNDYLEMVEEYVMKLVTRQDTEATEAAITQYQMTHAREIAAAQAASKRAAARSATEAAGERAVRLARAAAAEADEAAESEAAGEAAAASMRSALGAAGPPPPMEGAPLMASPLPPLPGRPVPQALPRPGRPADAAAAFWVYHRGGAVPDGISERKLMASVKGAARAAGGLDMGEVNAALVAHALQGL